MTNANVSDLDKKISAIEELSVQDGVTSFHSVKNSIDTAITLWGKCLDQFLLLPNNLMPWGKNQWAPDLIAQQKKIYDAATKVLLRITQSGSLPDQNEARNLLQIMTLKLRHKHR